MPNLFTSAPLRAFTCIAGWLFISLSTCTASAEILRGGRSVNEGIRQSIDTRLMPDVDRLIDDACTRGDIPGAVLVVGRSEGVVYRKAYGRRAIQPASEAMTPETVFDLASLTKPLACATSVMILVERGKIGLHDPVRNYLPDFGRNGKEEITIEQLLLHWSGLLPDNSMADFADGPATAIKKIYDLSPQPKPGTKFIYSDVGYIVLGELVRVVDGRSLDRFAREEIYAPLDMPHTGFLPPDAWRDVIAPTEKLDGKWLRGQVHDPRSRALGGVAGHAGLFAPADDLARFCRMILGGGQLDGKRVLKEETVRQMTWPHALPDGAGVRGLGFDIDTPYSSCRGERFPVRTSFGHTGFTGTMFWIDPADDCFFILLTNAVHPDGKGKTVTLRRQVATLVGEALPGPDSSRRLQPTSKPATRPAGNPVLTGIDVLKAERFKPLEGRRIALVTNQTGLDREGNRTIDLLASAANLKLVKLFAPEHGVRGAVDEQVADAVDPKTGLRVLSLYGKTNKPTKEMLEGIDTIVVDVQDVGARYYTYASTLGLCMESAAENKVEIVVLDRPPPVTGLIVDGPAADENQLGFIGYAPIPIAHGMTIGELARYFNVERTIGCKLTVIPCRNWSRAMWWDDTGLMWVNPSPNMRNPTQALLYLAVGQLEFSNVSVGRGTDQPFEQFGAPWVDGRKLAARLNECKLPGLRFTPITFKPATSKFVNEECQGVYITVTDRQAVEPVRAGLAIAWHLKSLSGDKFDIAGVGKMIRNEKTMDALIKADDPAMLHEAWEKPLAEFHAARAKYLLYE